ncbi:hypothetical protein ACOMHN_058934 [Nucella lapillus]
MTSHWAFYSQTGICIPLPVNRADFPGRQYSFGVVIMFHLIIFLLIAASQGFIFWLVVANTMSGEGSKGKDTVSTSDKTRSKEATVACRILPSPCQTVFAGSLLVSVVSWPSWTFLFPGGST